MASVLLHRTAEPVYGSEASGLVRGRVALVTGAGGSIGSEIVRQLHRLEAAEVYYLDKDEYALYRLQHELDGNGLLDDAHYLLADIANLAQLQQIMDRVRPHLVFHAAAHKHLPLLEKSPAAAIITNVRGTENVVRTAVRAGAELVVNISTDKAARPSSILGMSKRLGEMIAAGYVGRGTRIASVRFGNVLGSRGSFLETLDLQIDGDRPITITHPDVTRYFMTIPEAASLVIEAAVLAEAGETYVLDMGSPIRIMDVVARFAEAVNRRLPRIVFTGLRPGEKMHEELYDPAEPRQSTSHSRISKVHVEDGFTGDPDVLRIEVDGLYRAVRLGLTPVELADELVRLIDANTQVGVAA
ncbi:SDR family NAD(P)-dependent oxidoreductase [Kribbella sp. NPDC048915]|uniref:SDR family NAD(P)-dependent oxidoreductase n=1 Tax=Kribbella sp. NPDC048915 TaxID=3155148 RepID=UPI00340CE5A0